MASPSPPIISLTWYVANVHASWINRSSSPVKTLKIVLKNATQSVTRLINIPGDLLGIGETTYKNEPERWIRRARVRVGVRKFELGSIPTEVDVSVIDYTGVESPITNQVLSGGAVTETTFMWDDNDFDRLEAQALLGQDEIQLYNPNNPSRPSGLQPDVGGDPDFDDPPYSVGDELLVGSEAVEILAIVNATTGLYQLTANLVQTWPADTLVRRTLNV